MTYKEALRREWLATNREKRTRGDWEALMTLDTYRLGQVYKHLRIIRT